MMPLRRSTKAVLVSTLLGGLLAACGGDDSSGPSEPEPTPTASSLSVSPSSATATALDDTTSFAATVRDGDGNAMPNVTVDWSSSDDAVASVSGDGDDGEAVAAADGTAEVVAAAEGLADSATLTVDQEARRTTVSPGADTLTVGDSTRLSAEARDANDNALAEPDFAWSSSDTAVATVDSTGLARAKAGGSVNVRVEVDGVSDTSALQVQGDTTGGNPAITSVTSPLPETQQATIQGSGFSATPGDNVVDISGVQASVDQATAGELTITVPDLGCIPAGTSVDVTVTVSGRASTPYTVTTDPEEPAVSVSSGSQMIRTDPDGFCLQFPESSTSSRYLIGVQSLSSTVGSLTPIRVQSLAPGWNTSSSSLDVSPSVRTARLAQTRDVTGADEPSGGEVPRTHELEREHRSAEIELRRRERRETDVDGNLLPPNTTREPGVRRQVTSPSVGDTLQLRVPDLAASDACSNYVAVTGVVKEIGAEGIIIADTAAPSGAEGGYTSQDYQDFSDGLDVRFPALDSYFGSPGDRDGNGRVVALFTPATTRDNSNTLGFVYSGDLLDRSICPSSSEGEIFYGRVPDGSTSVEALRYVIPATIQHELTHVIQLSRHGDFLHQQISEGQANFAEEISGHADTDRQPHQNYGYSTARDPDQSDGVQWYADNFGDLYSYFGFDGQTSRIEGAPEECGWWRAEPSPCTARPLWYGVGWSFLRWVSDNYGPGYAGGEEQLHRDIITDPDTTGIPKVASLVGSEVSTLMARWAAALYLDDRVSGLQDGLTYSSWNLHDIVDQNTVETAHLKPVQAGFSSWQWEAEVRSSSSGYLLVSGTSRPATAVSVTNQAGATLPSKMQVWVVRVP